MKKKLHSIRIDGTTWQYAIGEGEVRVYQPGTKQIYLRIPQKDVTEGGMGTLPAYVRSYVINYRASEHVLKFMDKIKERFASVRWGKKEDMDRNKGDDQYSCLILAMAEVRNRTGDDAAHEELIQRFGSDLLVRQRGRPQGLHISNVRTIYQFNDHPETTWEDIQKLIQRTKSTLLFR